MRDRRTFLKTLAALPTLSTIAAGDLLARARKTVGISSKDSIYAKIGVTPIINARGTYTYVSGSLELPEVRAAKAEAALHFVDMWELQRGAGRRLAELSGAESGMVTAGAAAALSTATAACMAGTDPAKIWQLPDTTGMKTEVIMHGGRISFDNAIRLTGAKLVLGVTLDDVKHGLSDRTVMIYTTARKEPLEQVIAIAKQARVPILVDWAAGIPPIENLSLPWKMGADLYTFSGGKGLCGPQCSGLLLGRKNLIDAALAQSSPWEGALCRPMKVGKEEIMGVLAAIETWKKYDFPAMLQDWTKRAKTISQLVETVPSVNSELQVSAGGGYPTLTVTWDENGFKLDVQGCAKQLREGNPPIDVLTKINHSHVAAVDWDKDTLLSKGQPGPDRLRIVMSTLQPGEELIVGRRLREVLSQARKAAI
jgi:L-seryl-tRNA(Ser) seleniumtransferase